MSIKNEVLELLDSGKTTKAIKVFVEYTSEHDEELYKASFELKNRNKKNRAQKTLGQISLDVFNVESDLIMNELVKLLDKIIEEDIEIVGLDDLLIPKKIFISYNKTEELVADNLKEILTNNGATDIITMEKKNGENVSELLEQKISLSDVILLIISNKPLESAWLAMETINTFFNTPNKGKNFIVAHLDTDFFDWRYQMDGNLKLSKRIKELNQQLSGGLELEENFLFLSSEKKRLLNLKSNLDSILKNLKKLSTVDIRGNSLNRNIPKLIKNIRK